MQGNQLSADEVRKVAALARLGPTAEQVELYRGQLSAILGYVDRLRRVDLAGVEPLTHISESMSGLGEDIPGAALPADALMGMAPETFPPFVKVPKVIDGGGGA